MPTTIEGDENIEFKPTSAQADSLDGTTIADKKSYALIGNETVESVRILPGRMALGLVDTIWRAYTSLTGLCKNEQPHFLSDERLKPLVAGYLGLSYWINTAGVGEVNGISTTPPSEVHAVDLLNFLRTTYGDYFAQTDFGQELAAQGEARVVLARYSSQFPEVQALTQSTVSRELSAGKVVANPYLLVMHAAPEFRVALAGAIYIAEQNGEFNGVDFNASVAVSPACHPKPSFHSLLKLAEMLGIRDLKPLVGELGRIPQIKYLRPTSPAPLGHGGGGGGGGGGSSLSSPNSYFSSVLGHLQKKRKPTKKNLEEILNSQNSNLNNIIKPINEYVDKKILIPDDDYLQNLELITEYLQLSNLTSTSSASSTPTAPSVPGTQATSSSPAPDTPTQSPPAEAQPAGLLKRLLTKLKKPTEEPK